MWSSALCLHISANVWLHISVKPVVYLKYPLLMNRPKRYLFVYVFSHLPQEVAKSVCFSVMKVFFLSEEFFCWYFHLQLHRGSTHLSDRNISKGCHTQDVYLNRKYEKTKKPIESINHGCCFKVRNIKLILNCHQETAAVVAKGLLIRVCEKATLWLDLCKNFPAEFMVLVSPFGSYWIKKKSLFTKSWSYYVANWKIERETTCFEALAQDYIHLLYCFFFFFKKTQDYLEVSPKRKGDKSLQRIRDLRTLCWRAG